MLNSPLCTVLSCASAHRCLQLKLQNLRVGGSTEEVLERFNYPRARVYPRCEVSYQGVPNPPASLVHLFFTEASLTAECGPTHSLVAKLTQCLSLAVCKFCIASKEHCKQGYRLVCTKLCCQMSWWPEGHQNDPSYVHEANLLLIHCTKFGLVDDYMDELNKSQICQNWEGGGGGSLCGMGACLGQAVVVVTPGTLTIIII